jgi:hypothetical protein
MAMGEHWDRLCTVWKMHVFEHPLSGSRAGSALRLYGARSRNGWEVEIVEW